MQTGVLLRHNHSHAPTNTKVRHVVSRATEQGVLIGDVAKTRVKFYMTTILSAFRSARIPPLFFECQRERA